MSDSFKLSADQTILGLDGNPVANGQIHFYNKKTGEYAPVYGDAGLTVSLRQPVQANSSGLLPPIYLDDTIAYRAVIADRQNDRIREIDDVRRHREGIKVLGGVEALRRYCGNDPFVLVAGEDGCPVFYKRLSGCDLPEEKIPEVVRAECGCDCSVAWELCRCEPDICAVETAELTCDHHVLVQACSRDGATGGFVNQAPGCAQQEEPPRVQKASIGALLSAGAKCLPRVCIPHDAPELALTGGGLVQGDREPPPLQFSANGRFAGCIRVDLLTLADQPIRHVRLDTIADLHGVMSVPQIAVTNRGPCVRRYEIRALNRLNRARDFGVQFGGVPVLNANMQTRLGAITNPRLNDVGGVADYSNSLPWLTELSIADSTMGPFLSGHLSANPSDYTVYKSTNGYTENGLIVDLNPGQTIVFAVKYHIYWDMNATPAQLAMPERLHFGTRIVARPIH